MTRKKTKTVNCIMCMGIGHKQNSFGTVHECKRCEGSGHDPGVFHDAHGVISAQESVALFEKAYSIHQNTQRRLTPPQVKYIMKMSGSLSAEVVARDMQVSIRTVNNIWTSGTSYAKQ